MARLPPAGAGHSSFERPLAQVLLASLLLLAAVFAYEAASGRSVASSFLGKGSLRIRHQPSAQLDAAHVSGWAAPVTAPEDPQQAEAAEQEAAAAAARVAEAEEALAAAHAGAATLRLWKLTHSMMYWTHSDPVPMPSGGPLFQVPAQAQYITWEQDFAGMNNVRLQIENLVVMARLLHRTLVMPDHLCNRMDHLRDDDFHTIGNFFDFHDVTRWIPVISMQQYLDVRGIPTDDPKRSEQNAVRDYLRNPEEHAGTVYPKWNPNGDTMAVPSEEAVQARSDPSWQDFTARGEPQHPSYGLEEQQARTLHFKMEFPDFRLFGNLAGFWFFPSQGWQDFYYAGMRDHFHYHRDIIANASKIVHHLQSKFGTPFNALHDRADDFYDQFPGFFIDGDKLVAHVKLVLGEESRLPLYVAAKKINESRFAPLLQEFEGRVVFLKDVLDEVLPGTPGIYLGPIEQMVCSVARRFIGTFGSTFTGYVHRLRGHHQPALVPDKGVYYTNYPFAHDDEGQASYRQSVEDNPPWASIKFWRPPEGEMMYTQAMWAREFSISWDFARSEIKREHSVFEPARRRQRQRQRKLLSWLWR